MMRSVRVCERVSKNRACVTRSVRVCAWCAQAPVHDAQGVFPETWKKPLRMSMSTACRPKHSELSVREIEGVQGAGARGNLLHCACTYVYILFRCVCLVRPRFLCSKSGCRDPVYHIIPG